MADRRDDVLANERTPLRQNYGSVGAGEVFSGEPFSYAQKFPHTRTVAIGAFLALVTFVSLVYSPISTPQPVYRAAWSSKAEPFSNVNPLHLGIQKIDRTANSKPGKILDNLITFDPDSLPDTPLPTNAWYENLILGDSNTNPENKIFQIPHMIDTAGYIPGIRTHPCHLQSNDKIVMMTFEPKSGLVLGATEKFLDQHYVHKHDNARVAMFSKLAIELEWVSDDYKSTGKGSTMRTPIVRGSPYSTMKYYDATPRLFAERHLSSPIVVDNDPSLPTLECGTAYGEYSKKPILVQKELKVVFDTSDMTWLVFVSEPTEFECTAHVAEPPKDDNSFPGYVPPIGDLKAAVQLGSFFDLRATKPMKKGMVRVAMANNCTNGQNAEFCGGYDPRDMTDYEELLRHHSPTYPTAQADIQFTFPVSSEEEEELRLILNWRAANMFDFAADSDSTDDTNTYVSPTGLAMPEVEVLMYALPHHQERIRPAPGSTNAVQNIGCQAIIHGIACPVVGESWSLVEHLHRTSFYAKNKPRPAMVPAIKKALKNDITYAPPRNYMEGAGDTYFSGKMLAKLARILILADEYDAVTKEEFATALDTLRRGVEIWYKPYAGSPLLYDRAWGGMVTCGCDYDYDKVDKRGYCRNAYPNCPALTDFGQNFGQGYYNDHHYHFGYHIYASAVVAKFNETWGRDYHQHVMLLVRDIVNPSDDDEFFPQWRHKDWYLGFSWASGVVTLSGKPYPNGRNQESASEAIAAYEAVALYGDVMAKIYDGSANLDDQKLFDNANRIRDMGRLLMATEIRSMLTYWHVQAPGTPGVSRVYPDSYKPKVVGMMWSSLAQLQTWFGSEPWKSYGIQLMPITPAAELRDNGTWVQEMLPHFAESCINDSGCKGSGWHVLIYSCMSSIGQWQEAWKGAEALNETAFTDAGGNGHSLSNTLWYIATRPPPMKLQSIQNSTSSVADPSDAGKYRRLSAWNLFGA